MPIRGEYGALKALGLHRATLGLQGGISRTYFSKGASVFSPSSQFSRRGLGVLQRAGVFTVYPTGDKKQVWEQRKPHRSTTEGRSTG